MKILQKFVVFSFVLCLGLISVFGQSQTSNVRQHDLSQAEIDKIIKNVAKSEGEFREALKNYVYNRFAVIHSIGFGGQVTGEYRRDSYMTFDPSGEPREKILFNPISTIQDFDVTVNDIENMGGIDPFAILPQFVSQYNFTYIGKEKVDELDLYVFDVAPKVVPDVKKNIRLFIGRIWVDDRDLQIVKSKGKAIPEGKNEKFAIVETWRENIDGKYWFPAYSSVTGKDGELVFDNGSVARMKMRVKYTDYRQGRSDVKILDDDAPTTKPTPTPTPKKP